MGLKPALDKLKQDKRMTDINLKSRTLSAGDVQKTLKDLPDLADKAQNLTFNHEGKKTPVN
jgi:hypothetical protein